jgi:CRISPR-associated protein Cas2
MFYLVSYDISDDRKRSRVAKTLRDFGSRVQYSVFECIMNDKELEKLTTKLDSLISKEESVRIYTLCAKCAGIIRILGSGEVTKDEDVFIL